MRVLMVCSTFPGQGNRRCGIGDYTEKLISALEEAGVSVPLFREGPPEEALRAAREQDCGLIHWQYHPRTYGEGLAGVLLSLRNRRSRDRLPLVATMHTVRDAAPDSLLRSFLARWGADHLVFTNEYDARKASLPLLLPRKKRSVCPVGPTIEPSSSIQGDRRGDFGFAEDSFLISSFGFLNRGKGVPGLFQAMVRVKERVKDAALALIGEVRQEAQSLERELKELSASLGLDDCVRWLGEMPDSDVSKLLASSDLYVLPFSEGASTKRTTLMCGLAHGAAIVTTESKDKDFPLRQGLDLECVPRNDPEALGQKIVELWESPGRRRALGKAALEASSQFSWKRIAEDHVRLYRNLTERSP